MLWLSNFGILFICEVFTSVETADRTINLQLWQQPPSQKRCCALPMRLLAHPHTKKWWFNNRVAHSIAWNPLNSCSHRPFPLDVRANINYYWNVRSLHVWLMHWLSNFGIWFICEVFTSAETGDRTINLQLGQQPPSHKRACDLPMRLMSHSQKSMIQ